MMRFHKMMLGLLAGRRRAKSAPRPGRCRPSLECLEGRVVPAALVIGGTSAADAIDLSVNPSNSSQLLVTVNGSHQTFSLTNVTSVTVNAGAGNDIVRVGSTPSGIPLTVNGEGGDDTVVGTGDLDFVKGAVTVNGSAGTDKVVLQDGSASFGDTYAITASTVSRNFFGGLTYAGIEGLTLNAETGNNAINVTSTASATPVSINGNGGNDTITLGSGNLDALQGKVAVDGGSGNDTVLHNDSAVSFSDAYSITSSTVSRAFFGGLGYAGVEGLTLNAETSNNAINVTSTTSATILNVNGNGGNDTITLGGGNLDALQGKVTVNGGSGSDTVVLNDSAAPFSDTYTISGKTVSRNFFGGLTYQDIEGLTLNAEAGNNTIHVADTSSSVMYTLNGGAGTDTLAGPDLAKPWFLNGTNAGLLGKSVSFSGTENLLGGAGDDKFFFTGGSVSGTISGGGGSDTLDYSVAGSGVSVNLGAGTATATGGVSGIENVLGSAFNDTLIGDAGSNILVGSAGNDLLLGGDGRDLLVGGAGTDVLNGQGGDDIVIGASTVHDNDLPSLLKVMQEWTSTNDYATRVSHLRSGNYAGAVKLNLTTVPDDGTADLLAGGTGQDWFFQYLADTLTDRNNGGAELIN